MRKNESKMLPNIPNSPKAKPGVLRWKKLKVELSEMVVVGVTKQVNKLLSKAKTKIITWIIKRDEDHNKGSV